MTAGILVYVIDDDAPSRHSLSFALELSGYQVTNFASASAFLDDWSGEAGGIVVSDIRLPGLDGISLARHLREAGAFMPIILVTGHADEKLRADATTAGATAVLEKPFELRCLIAEIGRALLAPI